MSINSPNDTSSAAERDPLLSREAALRPAHQPADVDPDADDRMSQDPHVVLPRRRWIMEPVVLLFCVGILSQAPVLSQYIYYRVGQQFNATGNSSRAFVCDASSWANSSQHALTNRIQSEASSWTLYRSTVSSVIALLLLPIYASSSDYLGRKPALMLPAAGMMLDSIGLLLVVLLDLPLIFLVVSAGVGSLGGGFGTLFAAVFSYIADTTSRKWRPVRVAIVEAMFGVAGTVMELVMGWWIKLSGYSVPLVFSAVVVLVNLLYVTFLVPEVRLRRSPARESPAAAAAAAGCSARRLLPMLALPFRNIAGLFSAGAWLALRLALLLASLGLFSASFMGSSTVSSLYQMNYPFCLDSVFIGYLSAAKIVGYQVGAVFGLAVLRRFLHVSSLGLIVLGLLSSTIGSLLTGLAQSTAMLFVAAGAALFSMLAIPMFRAYASQIAPPERQGALFSCIGMLEVAGNLAGSTGFILLYRSTLPWMPGFVYLAVAGTTAVALLLSAACLLADSSCCGGGGWRRRGQKLSSTDEDTGDCSEDSVNR